YYDRMRSALRAAVTFQELFRIQRRHAARTRRSNGLPVTMILHVAGDEDTGNFRQTSVRGNQIPVLVGLQFSLENGCVWSVADRDEYTVERDFALLVRLRIGD